MVSDRQAKKEMEEFMRDKPELFDDCDKSYLIGGNHVKAKKIALSPKANKTNNLGKDRNL